MLTNKEIILALKNNKGIVSFYYKKQKNTIASNAVAYASSVVSDLIRLPQNKIYSEKRHGSNYYATNVLKNGKHFTIVFDTLDGMVESDYLEITGEGIYDSKTSG